MSPRTEWTAVRMKLIKGATSVQPTKVDDPSGTVDNDWYSIDLINPLDSNLVFAAGVAQHLSNEVFDTIFKWHQAALILDGEMVVQCRDNKSVYRAHKGDLFYWAPGLKIRIGGKFKAYFVKTPATWRWIQTPDGKKKRLNLFDIEGEINYPGSPPEENRPELIEEAKTNPSYPPKMPLIKFIRNALNAMPVQLDDSTQMPTDGWQQIDLVNPRDTDIGMVVGIAKHPTNTMNPNISNFYYHQAALIIEGEMINYDMNTGDVYKAQVGDLFYWGPGHKMRIGGKFKAYFVKTPVPLRWINTKNGKVVLNMIELENETRYPSSPPDETPEHLIKHA